MRLEESVQLSQAAFGRRGGRFRLWTGGLFWLAKIAERRRGKALRAQPCRSDVASNIAGRGEGAERNRLGAPRHVVGAPYDHASPFSQVLLRGQRREQRACAADERADDQRSLQQHTAALGKHATLR